MNGIRCAVYLGKFEGFDLFSGVGEYGVMVNRQFAKKSRVRIYGSHSEAKRVLRDWTDAYPRARLINEVDL